jgi:hypothetical protein
LNHSEPKSAPRTFARLVRLFLDRTFHGGDESGAGEVDLSLGLALSLLALPGALYSMLLFEKYSTLLLWMRGQHNFDPVAATVPDEYFFIVLSMVVTGAVAVWRWDSIFPDRRDYMNLVPLPISTKTIFLANLTAILCLAGVLALVVNAASVLLFPLAASASQQTFHYFAQLAGMHVLTAVLASVFSFFAVFGIVGVLMAALPYFVFRRISLYLRGLILVLLVAMLSTSFVIPSTISQLPHAPIRFLPSVWFLGLSQLIHGTASPALSTVGWLALKAMSLVIVIAMAAYAVSYKRYFVRIPEVADAIPEAERGSASRIFSILDGMVLRTPVQRAAYRFVVRTLLRSERHGLVIAGFAGLGIVVASQVLFTELGGGAVNTSRLPSAEVLSVPLIVIYCAMVGLRQVFDVPADLHANWIFKLSVPKDTSECAPLARNVMMTFVLAFMVAVVLPVYAYLWGWVLAGIHVIVIGLFSFLLAQVLLIRFRKVPFTCSYPPFKDSAIVTVLLCVLGFFVFAILISSLERRALSNPFYWIPLLLMVPAVWGVLSRFRESIAHVDTQLIFEERATAAFELLDLEQRS